MKKSVLLFFSFLFCGLVSAQNEIPDLSSGTKTELKNGMLYTTVTLRPLTQPKWTGEVWRSIVGIYGIGNSQVIKAGKDFLGTVSRGWILWDISSIPSNATIESASIKAYCSSPVSEATHRLEIKKLTTDPRTTSAEDLFNSIGNSTVLYTDLWNGMTTSGYHQISYQQAGLNALQNDLGNVYHGVGISESGENNATGTFRGWNWSYGANPEPMLLVTYSLPAPDLFVASATFPDSAQPGQRISLSCTITNTGAASAGANNLGYYLSAGSGSTYYLLGEHNIPPLSPGTSYLISDSVNLPQNVTPGTNYYLLFSADYLDQVSESNEYNNTLTKLLRIFNPSFTVTVAANPSEGGTVSGGRIGIPGGTSDTVNATPNPGGRFVNWTENGVEASSAPNYVFIVSASRNLTANFVYMVPNAPGNLGVQLNQNLAADLTWSDNSNNEEGFYIERKTGSSGSWQQISSVDSNATTFSDYLIVPGREYYYRVRSYNAYGTSAYSNEQSLQVSGTEDLKYQNLIPDNNFLSNNYPNPFNPSTKFSFGLKSEAAVRLSVYSITGQLVENIIDNPSMTAGIYTCSYSPAKLSSGLYLYVLTVAGSGGNFTETKKMVYIK